MVAYQTPLVRTFLGGLPSIFSPTLFFDVLLPPIVFEAAVHVNFHLMRARAGVILFLIFVALIFTTLFAGLAIAYLLAFPLAGALLLASILSPTDPVAVVDLFKRMRVPRELATIVESESLLNDAVGFILFTVILGILETGRTDPFSALGEFLWLTGAGAAIGLAVAAGVHLLHRELHDPPVETALTVVAAFGSYLLATGLGASGIVATAIAGIAVGTYVAPRAMDPEVRHSVVIFWGVITYIVN